MNELKDALKKFDTMLVKIQDNPKNSYEFLYFFRTFIRIKANNLPILELGAILKHEKPKIFHELRQMSSYNQAIEFITGVEMNYTEAVKRVNNYK